jgi:hypothetical protein
MMSRTWRPSGLPGEVLLEVLDEEAADLACLFGVEQLVEEQVSAVGVFEYAAGAIEDVNANAVASNLHRSRCSGRADARMVLQRRK